MKLAVTAKEPSLDAAIDPRFGRCAFFVLIETDGMKVQGIQNPYVTASGAAGTRSAQLLIDNEVECLLTGRCGPNAQEALAAAGIEVVTDCHGSVADAVAAYRSGQ